MCFAPQWRALFRHLNLQKWSERVVFLNMLTSKCASRHNGVHFFDIATSKSGPTLCFAPQRRALFRHRNFQKWSDAGVFCTFCLGNVLRATNGVQFFISHLASWLRTRRFSEPTFLPSGSSNHWKNTVFRDFPTFSRICIFFLLTLSLLLFSLLIFSLLSASALLCFSSVHIVGSLTSKLPSVNPLSYIYLP